MGNVEYRIQLKDTKLGKFGSAVVSAGGVCMVCAAGTGHKQSIVDKDGTALTNPLVPTRGFINFFTVSTVASVDLYIQFPGGQFKVVKGVTPSGPNEIGTDTSVAVQLYEIPFSITDSVANTEKDTGFDFPAKAIVLDRLHGTGVNITTLDSGQNILFGLLASESGGDADGLSTNISTTAAILKSAANGALFSSNAPHLSDAVTAKSISYTLDTGTDTAEGFILIPLRLPVDAL